MTSDFIHLHCHTEHSVLDGLPKAEEYVYKCSKLGMPGIAITEHGNMTAVIKRILFRLIRPSPILHILFNYNLALS